MGRVFLMLTRSLVLSVGLGQRVAACGHHLRLARNANCQAPLNLLNWNLHVNVP